MQRAAFSVSRQLLRAKGTPSRLSHVMPLAHTGPAVTRLADSLERKVPLNTPTDFDARELSTRMARVNRALLELRNRLDALPPDASSETLRAHVTSLSETREVLAAAMAEVGLLSSRRQQAAQAVAA